MGAASAQLDFEPVELPAAELEPLALVGAWRLRSPDRRVGGISAIAAYGDELVAVTDSGAIVRFDKAIRPGLTARVADLPAGPGDRRFKMNRDSEAIALDPQGRGWWIAFEARDELWLFDHRFTRALRRLAVPAGLTSATRGIEGLAVWQGGLLAFPESGGSALAWRGGRWSRLRLERRSALSGAVELGDGLVLLIERRLTPAGLHNALALVRPEGAALRTLWRKRLPAGRLDNFEGIAAQPNAGGGYRLWIVSDDNFHPRMRTC